MPVADGSGTDEFRGLSWFLECLCPTFCSLPLSMTFFFFFPHEEVFLEEFSGQLQHASFIPLESLLSLQLFHRNMGE